MQRKLIKITIEEHALLRKIAYNKFQSMQDVLSDILKEANPYKNNAEERNYNEVD